jgi:hypothetical protein
MGNGSQGTTGGEVDTVGGIVPVGEISDEVQQGAAEFHQVIEQGWILARAVEPAPTFRGEQDLPLVRRPFLHGLPRGIEKFDRAVRVGGIGPERRQDYGPACRQGPACPPDVQGRDVAVTNAFLAPRMG